MPIQSVQHYKNRFELAVKLTLEDHKNEPPELKRYIQCRCAVDEDDLSDENMPFLTEAIRNTENMPQLLLDISRRSYRKKAHEALIRLAESCPTLTGVIIHNADPDLETQRKLLMEKLEENKKKLRESKKLSKSVSSAESGNLNATAEECKKDSGTVSALRSVSLTPPASPRIASDQPGGSDYGIGTDIEHLPLPSWLKPI